MGLGPLDAKALGRALATNESLTALVLGSNDLGAGERRVFVLSVFRFSAEVQFRMRELAARISRVPRMPRRSRRRGAGA